MGEYPVTAESTELVQKRAKPPLLPWQSTARQDKKKGHVPAQQWLINGFQEAILDCNLIDIPLEGYQFTWRKSLGTAHAVEEDLDRALATPKLFQVYHRARLKNLLAAYSVLITHPSCLIMMLA